MSIIKQDNQGNKIFPSKAYPFSLGAINDYIVHLGQRGENPFLNLSTSYPELYDKRKLSLLGGFPSFLL